MLTLDFAIQKFIAEIFSERSSEVENLGGPTGYDDLLKSDKIDAVYVPLPTT